MFLSPLLRHYLCICSFQSAAPVTATPTMTTAPKTPCSVCDVLKRPSCNPWIEPLRQCFDNDLFPSKVSGNREASLEMPVVASKSDDTASNSVANETADAAASVKVSTTAPANSDGDGFGLDANETADASASAKVPTTARARIFALAYAISHAQPLVHLYDRICKLGQGHAYIY